METATFIRRPPGAWSFKTSKPFGGTTSWFCFQEDLQKNIEFYRSQGFEPVFPSNRSNFAAMHKGLIPPTDDYTLSLQTIRRENGSYINDTAAVFGKTPEEVELVRKAEELCFLYDLFSSDEDEEYYDLRGGPRAAIEWLSIQ